MTWVYELLRDAGKAIFGYLIGIDPEWDPVGCRPASSCPWYISAVFCLVVAGLLGEATWLFFW